MCCTKITIPQDKWMQNYGYDYNKIEQKLSADGSLIIRLMIMCSPRMLTDHIEEGTVSTVANY